MPVTARLPEEVVEALDTSVRAGVALTRGAAIQAAAKEWLTAHGEDAIAASYRRRYAQTEPEHHALIASLAAVSANACLVDDGT